MTLNKFVGYAAWLFILIFLTIIWSFRYFPTIDGPSHLAIAADIKQILLGECPILKKLFIFTPAAVPNWIVYPIIISLNYLFAPEISEKIIITTYIIIFFIIFKRLLLQINLNSIYLILLTIVFIGNSNLYSGNYNFIIGLVLCFVGLYWWLNNYHSFTKVSYLKLSALFLLLYFSHLFSLAMFCLTILNIISFDLITQRNKASFYKTAHLGINHLLALLPCLTLFYFYFSLPKLPISLNDNFFLKLRFAYTPSTLLNIDDYQLKRIFAVRVTAVVLWNLVAFATLNHFKDKKTQLANHVLLFNSLIISLLIIFGPSSFGGGWLIEERLHLYSFLFLILWLANFNFPNFIKISVIAILILLNIVILFNRYNYIKSYNSVFSEIASGESFIEPDKTVLNIDLTPPVMNYSEFASYPQCTLSTYIASKQCTADIYNFQAAEQNSFPLTYRQETNPHFHLGLLRDKSQLCIIPPVINIAKYENESGITIDYITLRGDKNLMFRYPPQSGINEKENYDKLLKQINEKFILIYQSKNGYISVYKKSS